MRKKVEKFLEEYDLLNSDKSYLVAFSGGADSLCLLNILNDICREYSIELYAMHLNHNWRGKEALAEMHNCEEFCKKNNISIFTKTLAENTRHTELAAREERQKFFEECFKKVKNPVIFTGHTSSDNAETLIYRIAKGTGINGLKGILPKQNLLNMEVYRPLLNFSRKDTINYCEKNGLKYNTDSSNSDTKYKRNFIRLEVMPKLENINQNAQNSINTLSHIAQSEMQIIEEYLSVIKKDVCDNDKYSVSKFLNLSKPVQYHLIYDEFLSRSLDYNYERTDNIIKFIYENKESKSGSRCSVAKDLWLYVNSKEFCFIEKLKETISELPLKIKNTGVYEFDNYQFEIKEYSDEINVYPKETDNYAYVDLSNFDFDFVIRTRKDGDIIEPFGMHGSMKFKKYLNSKKIPQHQKDSIVLFCKENEILWAANIGLSDKIRVAKFPTHMLILKNKTGVI